MQDNSGQGGDGIVMGPTGDQPIEQAAPIQGDRSANQAELETKIEQELGLPHTEAKKTEVIDESKADATTGAEDDKTTGAKDDTEESDSEEPEEKEVVEPATPSDEELFIEVEDAEGVTHKISKIEDLPEDFSLKNNRQGLEILKGLAKLENQMEKRDADRLVAEEKAAVAEAQKVQFNAWDNEITELHKEKRIDPADTDRVNKVFEHIAKINQTRAKAGNPNLITSFEDGLDKFEASEAKEAANDKKKQENERAKSKSSLIGGSNSTGAGAAQPYYSGRYRSMDDVPV